LTRVIYYITRIMAEQENQSKIEQSILDGTRGIVKDVKGLLDRADVDSREYEQKFVRGLKELSKVVVEEVSKHKPGETIGDNITFETKDESGHGISYKIGVERKFYSETFKFILNDKGELVRMVITQSKSAHLENADVEKQGSSFREISIGGLHSPWIVIRTKGSEDYDSHIINPVD